MAGRFKAFFTHLACSVVVACALAYIVFGVWYPEPLGVALGVLDIFLTVLIVDTALGPLITLVIYKKEKKWLAMDLAVVVVLQAAALIYGVHVVAEGRPVWIVFNVDRFDIVQATEINPENRAKAASEYQELSWFGPRWVASDIPEDRTARTELLFNAASGGADLPQRPDLYRPLSTQKNAMKARGQSLQALDAFNSEEEIATTLARWPNAASWLPLSARDQSMVVLLDDQQQVVAVAPLKPWLD